MLGDSPISALNDNTNRAKICSHFYEEVRDATIRAFPWNFATRYLNFGAALSTPPAFEFTTAHQLPVNPYVLRVRELSDRSIRHKVVGRELYSNESTINAICLVRIEDEAEFDALFREAFAARLAAMLAWPLTKNRQLQRDSWDVYLSLLQEGREIDSHEGTSDDIESEALIDVRYG